MATINLGNIKFNWQGAYNGATAYAVDDVVESGGSTYICILASTGNTPPNATYWELMSQAGTNGTDLTSTLTTQGDILYRDGSGLQRLGAGTSGQVLQTNGTGANPSWVNTSSGGAWTLLNTQTVSNVATLDFESLVDNTYNLYAIYIFDFHPVSTGQALKLNISEDNGTTYNTSNYQYHVSNQDASSTAYSGYNSTGGTGYELADNVKGDNIENFHGIVYISADFNSAYQPKFWHQGFTKNAATGQSVFHAGAGTYNGGQSNPTNAFRLLFSSGNISAGTATLYGLAKN